MAKFMNLVSTDFSGYTLIIPSISVGNVPQLTVDLLITTFDLKKITTLWHPAIVASVGNDPYFKTSKICTACELYAHEDLQLATIQLRSTLESKLALQFFHDLQEMLFTLKFKSVVILSSAFDYELPTISNEKFYFIGNENINKIMGANNVKPLQLDIKGSNFVNGSGFAVKLYGILETNVSCILLMKYVSEGDNRPDAIGTLVKLFQILKSENIQSKVIFPSSWEFVFGGPPPVGIY